MTAGEAGHGPSLAKGAALLLAVVLAAYAVLHDAGFVWDDDAFLWDNPLIHAPDGLYRFWFTREPPDYFPLTSSMLWFEWRLFGGDATGYHVVNVLLHGLGAILLWRVLLEVRVRGAFVGALLFAVHPLAVESVAWITQRKSTLPLVLGLLALLLWLRQRERGGALRLALATFVFLLALLAKTSVVALPLVGLLLVHRRNGAVRAADLRAAAPLLVLSLVLGLVTMSYQSGVAIGDEIVRDDGLANRVALAGCALWFYLSGAVVPAGACFVHPRWSTDAPAWFDFLPLVLWIGVLVGAARSRLPALRGLATALLAYTLLLAPVLGLVDIFFMKFSLVADHWQYPGLPVVCAVLGALSTYVPGLRLRLGVVTAVTLCFAALTVRGASTYRSERDLFEATVRCNPDAWLAHFRLGALAADAGDLARAERHFRDATAVDPEYGRAHFALGRVFARQNDLRAAEAQFRLVLGLPGTRPAPALGELANVLLAQGRLTEAEAAFQESLAADPARPNVRNNYASLLARRRRFDEALAQLDEALRLDPTFEAARTNRARIAQQRDVSGE